MLNEVLSYFVHCFVFPGYNLYVQKYILIAINEFLCRITAFYTFCKKCLLFAVGTWFLPGSTRIGTPCHWPFSSVPQRGGVWPLDARDPGSIFSVTEKTEADHVQDLLQRPRCLQQQTGQTGWRGCLRWPGWLEWWGVVAGFARVAMGGHFGQGWREGGWVGLPGWHIAWFHTVRD